MRLGVLLLLALVLVPRATMAAQQVDDFAPLFVENGGLGDLPPYQRALGPIVEHRPGPPELTAVRPLWVELRDPDTQSADGWSLYPLFGIHMSDTGYDWRIYELIFGGHQHLYNEDIRKLEIWPLFWYHRTGNPETSYIAQFPLGGTLKGRLFYKRLDWILFPLWVRAEQRTYVDHSYLWPIFRVRSGHGSSGFGVFPLFGHFQRQGDYSNTYALWPIFYNDYDYSTKVPGDTYHKFGVLPLYARETAKGLRSETFIWPFFGYTVEKEPRVPYHEVRFFYPLGVEGRGKEKYVNRLLPFYDHERKPGYEKHWYLWPLLETEQQQLADIQQHNTTVLFFLYKDRLQTAPQQPGWSARRTDLWPLFSYWDNGAGQRQFQLISPLEPFFPGNVAIQKTWNPFFAIYRYSQVRGGERHSLLWDLVLWEDTPHGSDFHIGPLFSRATHDGASHWSLLHGLVSIDRGTPRGTRLRALWGLIK